MGVINIIQSPLFWSLMFILEPFFPHVFLKSFLCHFVFWQALNIATNHFWIDI